MIRTSDLDGTFWNLLRRIKHGIPRAVRNWEYRRAIGRIRQLTNMRVVDGPFKGMLVSGEHVYGAPVAKLLGTYEMELHPQFQRIINNSPRNVIDVGGAEGYYAIGMALQGKVGHVLVWESLEAGRKMIEHFARANNVFNKIEIRGECCEPDLYEAVTNQQGGLLIMDIEGAELDLLSPRVCSALGTWFLVVEAHDLIRPGCTERLIRMFEPTHKVDVIQTAERIGKHFPLPMTSNDQLKKWLMDEGRGGSMNWIIGAPKER